MTTTEFVLVLGMVVVTFGARYPVLALVSRLSLPPWLENSLKFVPVAVLTAIVVPALVAPTGADIDISIHNEYLVAGFIAAAVSWYRRNLLLTIVAGMASLWIWRTVLAMLS
jgi:branched-subunit amino acid transport protein